MSVVAQHTVGLYYFSFECGQWAGMSDDSKAEWTELSNDCAYITELGSPYASSPLPLQSSGSGAIEGTTPIAVLDTGLSTQIYLEEGTVDGDILVWTAADGWQPEQPSGGTVTSVAATAPAAGFTITGSPITGAGTFVFTFAEALAERRDFALANQTETVVLREVRDFIVSKPLPVLARLILGQNEL